MRIVLRVYSWTLQIKTAKIVLRKKGGSMKKIIGIVIASLVFCNIGFAEVKLIEARTEVKDSLSGEALRNGVSLQMNAAPLNVNGSRSVRSLEIAVSKDNKWQKGNTEYCDLVLVSGGWSPVVHLLSHRGIRPIWDKLNACFIPSKYNEPITVVGSASGIWDKENCIASGIAAGLRAAESLGIKTKKYSFPSVGGWLNPIKPLYEVKISNYKTKNFV